MNKEYIIDEETLKVVKELIDKSLRMTIAIPAKMTEVANELESISAEALQKLNSVRLYKRSNENEHRIVKKRNQ